MFNDSLTTTCICMLVFDKDAGQERRYGATQCDECGMVYTMSEPADETMHYKYHASLFSALKFPVSNTQSILPVLRPRLVKNVFVQYLIFSQNLKVKREVFFRPAKECLWPSLYTCSTNVRDGFK